MCFIGLRLKINLYTIFPAIGVLGGEFCHCVIRTDNPSCLLLASGQVRVLFVKACIQSLSSGVLPSDSLSLAGNELVELGLQHAVGQGTCLAFNVAVDVDEE